MTANASGTHDTAGNILTATPRPAATIYDIAKLAEVSPSTVSRALNKPGRISAKTERRIRDAARQLNYRVNPMARALPTGRTRMIGLVVADVTNPMLFGIMSGAQRAATQAHYTLIVIESQESEQREIEAVDHVTPTVDGLVLATTRAGDEAIREFARHKPVVLVNRTLDTVTSLVPDLHPGIGQALSHLHTLGHRRIAYLSGPTRSWMSGARWKEIFAGAVARGMNVVEIGPNPPTLRGGHDVLERVAASGVTAVLAYNDLIGIGLLRAAQERGTDVPGKLSIIGFDNIFGSDFTTPPLTTIALPFDALGELAVRTVFDILDPDTAPGAPPPDTADLTTELIVRGSTAPPPGRPHHPTATDGG